MSVVFAGVLLCSFAIEKLFAPAGKAILRAAEARQVNVTGVIAASRSEPGKLTLHDGTSCYLLADQGQARTYAGHKVHVVGIFYESTGLLEIQNIDPLPL